MANNHWMSLWRSTGEALALAAVLAVPTFGGLLLGNTIDQWHNSQPTFTLGLLVLGIVGGFYSLILILRRIKGRKP